MNLSPEIQTYESTSRHKRLSLKPGGFMDRVFLPFDPQSQESKPMNPKLGIKNPETKIQETQTRESASRHNRLSPNPGGFVDRVFPPFEHRCQES